MCASRVCVLPVFRVRDGVDDGVVDGRGFGDDGGHRVHVGSQHVGVPAAGTTEKVQLLPRDTEDGGTWTFVSLN